MGPALRGAAALALVFLPACRTTDSRLLDDTGPCPDVKAFALTPPPGKEPGAVVMADGSDKKGRVVASDRGFFFRYCPAEDKLHSVTSLANLSGIVELENSLSARFTTVSGINEAFAQGQAQSLVVTLESRNRKIEGAKFAGQPIVFVGAINSGPLSPLPAVGVLAPIADIPRPSAAPQAPTTQPAFLTCDPGNETVSFSDAAVTRGADAIQIQLDACLDGQETVTKSAVLLVIKSEANTQIQTDVIQIAATEGSGAQAVIFNNISATTTLVFASDTPLGRNAISKVAFQGRSDGSLDFTIDDAAVEPVTMAFGALRASGDCLPGEDVAHSAIKFTASTGPVEVKLTSCQVFQFGATGTTSYRLKEIEIADPDDRLASPSRVLKGEDLTARAKLQVSHHNSCDKLAIALDDVQYGFTSPETFSIGNGCEEDDGVAPANPEPEVLAIRKRIVAGNVVEMLTVPWGKGLTYAPKIVLTEGSDPLE